MIPKICAAMGLTDLQKELIKLLDQHPQLVLEKGQQQPPDRVYEDQTFELGIRDEERNKIFYRSQYPPNPAEINEYRKIIQPLVEAGVFVRTDSPHNNPVMLVPKKSPGDFRMVIDIRQLNKACRPVGGMRASTLDIIKTMKGAKFFTTLDCKNAFYSLKLAKKDWPFTAISPPGEFRLMLTRMPMGAKASTAALYQAMVATLGDALYRYALVWADDIIIFSKSEEEHIRHVADVLDKLDAKGFCVAREKIELGKSEVKWLGYIISDKGIRPDDEKVEKLIKMRRPRNVKELRSALGMWTYFTAFIPGYSIIAAPLMQLLHKDNKEFRWSKRCSLAWNTIKNKLASAPTMGYPDYSLPLRMDTDAGKCEFAVVMT